ncbi:MAG: hypothetical protein AVDCRST_MAG88-3971 [uncultured Thermomicrobiales bacterium]|uniref:TfoX N-terminal domain-containing protein n=1 Tax=uncultured Thermomicrobiales bacterium TaxID=1645740 RepID=A0A6J4VQZ1_9BACT|nr:MAG: hypothetical protein AVDCRST_MAG88-3971 [uncultured Thermomicrobiales bacterium]
MGHQDFAAIVLDRLLPLGEVGARAMFGCRGLYCDGTFFGIVQGERLYLKTDPATRPAYERRGMGPFRPNARQTIASFYEVPADVLTRDDELLAWAHAAVAAQRRLKAAGHRRARQSRPGEVDAER